VVNVGVGPSKLASVEGGVGPWALSRFVGCAQSSSGISPESQSSKGGICTDILISVPQIADAEITFAPSFKFYHEECSLTNPSSVIVAKLRVRGLTA
jgi:hypothetical protein